MKLITDKKKFLSHQFQSQLGYTPNIDKPKSFNEKLQWLKLYYHQPLLTQCADKYAAREYITSKIGSKYLIPLIGSYDSEEQINFKNLPQKFIIKTNNNSGQNIVCLSKSQLNIKDTKIKLKNLLLPKSNLYYYSFEWPYKNIKPKIIIESLLQPKGDLIEYQFFCFNGQPKFILVISERQTGVKVDVYDLNWKLLPVQKKSPNSKNGIKKPACYTEMIEISKSLSKPFPFVRVDLYQVNNKIYTGELTFFPNAGMGVYNPISWDYKFGDMLVLPKSPNIFVKLVNRFL